MQGASDALLTTAELAERADLTLGDATVRPSTRTVTGPGGSTVVEPRVMQVLLVLADARESVVTRDTLLRRCWGNVFVGDDSLNRAIAGVRRAASAAGGGFEVETIPRTGYRLVTRQPQSSDPGDAPAGTAVAPANASATRRWVVVGGAAAAATGLGLWAGLGPRADPRAQTLIEQGRRAIRDELPVSTGQGVELLRQAVAIDPDNAAAWGLLALALRNRIENAPPEQTTAAVHACEAAARRALELDPNEGNALTALATMRPFLGDWIAAEDRLRQVLAVAPDTPAAVNHLTVFLQAVGRIRESYLFNERAVALDPLSPIPQFRKALKFWIAGDIANADLTIDRAMQLWPRHPAVWNARLYIFAFTGRARAALALVEDRKSRPATFSEAGIALWHASLEALETRSAAAVAAAREAIFKAAPVNPGFTSTAIMVLSALDELDAAFAVADGYYLRRGPVVGTLWVGSDSRVNDQIWRRTMNLFTPATAPMRGDRRFHALCEGMGLTDYWRRRGVTPDHLMDRG